jgi:hypothetical protein
MYTEFLWGILTGNADFRDREVVGRIILILVRRIVRHKSNGISSE